MITVYCLRRAGEPAPAADLTGPYGAPVALLEEEAIGAWISAGPSEPRDPGVEAVRAYDAVVRAALRSATPVPVRFGTTYRSEEALRASLRERQSELLAALRKVDGMVEMGLKVEWEAGNAASPALMESDPLTSGRAYLERRRGELEAKEALRSRASALLDAVEARVVPEGTPAVRTLLSGAGVAGAMAHLVHRYAVGVYRRRVEEAQAALPQVRLRVTGPWAPYSFV